MALTAAQYLAHLQALLPTGAAWNREPGSVQTNTLEALAQELARVSERFDDLIDEVDVRTADQLLADWERVLGLPDSCMATADLSVADRRMLATQRLVEQGGASPVYFITLATLIGEPGCTITEFRPINCNNDCNDALYSTADAFTWRVNVPHQVLNARFATCQSDCNSALQMYTPGAIECLFNERKPAHTTVAFAYTP